MKTLRFLNALCLLALFAQVAGAQGTQMNLQGQLATAGGEPADGNFGFEFRIYNDSLGGSPLLTETQRLRVFEGFFSTTINVRSIRFDNTYFVGFSVEGGPELRPRLPLFPSPYSFSTRSLFGETNVVPSAGNVGFGTRNPRAPLHVVGDVIFDDLRILPPDSLLPFLVLDPTGIVRLAPPGPFLGGFNGMLQGVPLIVKDAAGNEVFRVNPDGTSFHKGLERFDGGLVVPIPGVGDISISEFGVIIPLANGGGISISEDGISMVDGNGDEVFRINPDGTSFHAGLETYAGGISVVDGNGDEVFRVNPDGTSFHAGLETFFGGLQVPTSSGLTRINIDPLRGIVFESILGAKFAEILPDGSWKGTFRVLDQTD